MLFAIIIADLYATILTFPKVLKRICAIKGLVRGIMSLFSRKEGSLIVEHVRNSFEKVRREFSEVINWLHYFHKKHEEHEIRLRLIENQITYMPKSSHEIKQIIDTHYSHEPLLDRVQRLHDKINDIKDSHRPISRRLGDVEYSLSKQNKPSETLIRRINELQNKLDTLERRTISTPPARNQLKEKIVEQVARNSKQYVKNAIFSLIQKYGNITGLQLKNIVVDEQGLCSRSSFYRLLNEVEQDHPISFAWQGKEKHYLADSPSIKN